MRSKALRNIFTQKLNMCSIIEICNFCVVQTLTRSVITRQTPAFGKSKPLKLAVALFRKFP